MRVVVDTNIVFSAILNTNSKIARILLQPRTGINFYSTEQLSNEINNHFDKLKKLSKYSETDLKRVILIITHKIRFINIGLVPKEIYGKALELTKDIDIDDTEFVALCEHTKSKLWTGDKVLREGLIKKNWNRFITTDELTNIIF